MTGAKVTTKAAVVSLVIPYLLGLILSSRIDLVYYFGDSIQHRDVQTPIANETLRHTNECCNESMDSCFKESVLESVSIVVHRNGEAWSCGEVNVPWRNAFRDAVESFGKGCPKTFNKFEAESFLTHLFAEHAAVCTSDREERKHMGFLGHCDGGVDYTPLLPDHDSLVKVPPSGTLPCRFYTREGLHITSLQKLVALLEEAPQSCSTKETCAATSQLHLYATPAGRVFMHAPRYVGEMFDLPHVQGPDGVQVSLEALSVSPRVFALHNFFTKDESADLVRRAMTPTSESQRLKRSAIGAAGNSINTQRTSESGYDTHGTTAMAIKKRSLQLLGYDDEYKESENHVDGLQILRYNTTMAYVPHLDYLNDASGTLKHDYDSSHKGGNRYATILLYMNDMDTGGETVFTNGLPIGQEVGLPHYEALRRLRASGDAAGILQKGSWEEAMVAACRSRLAIRPRAAQAILFYSQLPNGELDPASLHGGCPVLKGEKWAANLWVWNTPRDGFPGHPINPNYDESSVPTPMYKQIRAKFQNSGTRYPKADLYHGDEYLWSTLNVGDPPVHAKTYESHQWDVRVNGTVVQSWTISETHGERQTFLI